MTCFARAQYVVLLPAFLLGALAVERWSIRRTLRSFPISFGFAALALALAPVASARLLGRYEVIETFSPSTHALHWLFSGAFLLAVGVGVAMVPGAVAFSVSSLTRVDDRARTGFAAVGVVVVGMLIVVASVMTVETSSDRFLERYLIVAAPLSAVAFACWVSAGRPARWLAVVTGIGLLVVAMRLTLGQFTVMQGIADSPTLFALSTLERLSDVGLASLLAALAISVGACLGIALALRGSFSAAPVWVFTGVLFVAIAGGAVSADRTTARPVRTLLATGPVDWIDRQGVKDVLLVQTPGSQRFDAMLTSVLNKSIVQAKSLGEARIQQFDGLSGTIGIDGHGRLVSDGSPVRRPVAFATGGTAASFTGARRTIYDRSWVLVQPRRSVRLSMLADGVRSDGRLSPRGEITLYPQVDQRCTVLTLRLSLPESVPATTLQFVEPGGERELMVIRPGGTRVVSWKSHAKQARHVRFRTLRLGNVRPSPFVATVANVAWSSKPSSCHGSPLKSGA